MPRNELVGPNELHLRMGKRGMDPFRHLNHVIWGVHLESGRLKLAHNQGVNIADRPATSTPLKQMSISFTGQIQRRDEIGILTAAKEEEGLIIFEQKVLKGDSTKPIGEALTVYGQPESGLIVATERPLLDLPLTLEEEFFQVKDYKLNHLAALICFEEERLRLFESRGFSLEDFSRMGILVVTTAIDMRFAREMHIGQQVHITTHLHSRHFRLFFRHQMIEDGQVVNEADTAYVVLNGETLKPMIPSAQLMDQLTGPQTIETAYSIDRRWLK